MSVTFLTISLGEFIQEVLQLEKEVQASNLVKSSVQHGQTYYPHTQTTGSGESYCDKKTNDYADNEGMCSPGNGGCDPSGTCYNSYGFSNHYYCSEHTQTSNVCTDVTTGFNHNNYIPSIPYIYNESQKLGKPLRDTATINVFSYDGNLQDNLGTQNAQSKDIYFSVELKKVSNFDGSPVSAADAAWHYVGNFMKSPLAGGQTVTQTPIASQKADSSGMTSFTINTRNPFGKGTYDARAEEGVYQLRVVAWNTYLSANGVTKYYISSTRYETLEFRQNFVPEVELTNESSIRSFIFSNHGVKTDAPAFKAWADDVYNNDYANAQNMTEGIFIRFSMRDQDTEAISAANWQTGKAYLRKSDGTEIAQADVWFSDGLSKGDNITQSNGSWKTGYAYFGNWLFPANADLTDCTVMVEIKDYFNAACTDAIGTYQVASTTLDIDTIIPAITDITQSTSGLNTSTVKPGIGITNTVYEMKMRVNTADSHPRTKIRTVQYAITGNSAFPDESELITAVTDTNGSFVTPPITKNGTYYIHVYAQDYTGNSHKATYGPYTRRFEPELIGDGTTSEDGSGSGHGIYLAEMRSAGKTHTFDTKPINGLADLGLPLSDGLKMWYRQGYSFILRVAVANTDKLDLDLKYGDTTVPVRLLGYRKFEAPEGSAAVIPAYTSAGDVETETLSIDRILPDVVLDIDGHLVCDTESVYVAEFQVYMHRDILLQSGSGNTDKTLGLKLKLTGQLKYPDGHPLAGQNVFAEADFTDVFTINNNVTNDGGTNSKN